MNTSADERVLTAERVSKSFGGNRVLQDVELYLNRGELVSVVGRSGSGKTTLFHIIAGLYAPDTGVIRLHGEDVTEKPGRISYMLQKDLLLPYRTVLDNAGLPLMLRGESKKKARTTASALFADFGLEGCQKKYPSQLSGGMRQRAALLRTWLASREMALLDEPFSALDTITKHEMHRWYLQVMRRLSLPTLFITHDLDEAVLLSDRVYILGGTPGRIVGEVAIDAPKPRPEDFALTNEFLSYKRRLSEALKLDGAE